MKKTITIRSLVGCIVLATILGLLFGETIDNVIKVAEKAIIVSTDEVAEKAIIVSTDEAA